MGCECNFYEAVMISYSYSHTTGVRIQSFSLPLCTDTDTHTPHTPTPYTQGHNRRWVFPPKSMKTLTLPDPAPLAHLCPGVALEKALGWCCLCLSSETSEPQCQESSRSEGLDFVADSLPLRPVCKWLPETNPYVRIRTPPSHFGTDNSLVHFHWIQYTEARVWACHRDTK